VKKNFIVSVLVLVLVSMVGACAFFPATPKLDDLARADYGPAPTNVDSAVNEWLKGHYADPFSAVVEYMGELKQGWWRTLKGKSDLYLPMGLATTYVVHYGWILPVRINGKNKLGAFTGFVSMKLYFKGDDIVAWE
jgi:hypothetical protein